MESGAKSWLCWDIWPANWFLLFGEPSASQRTFCTVSRPLCQQPNSCVFGKEDKPVFYRKGPLFPGSGCGQLRGLFGWLWRRDGSQNANHQLAQPSTIEPQGTCKKVNKNAPFQILKKSSNVKEARDENKCVGEEKTSHSLLLKWVVWKIQNPEGRGFVFHYQDSCAWQPYSSRDGFLHSELEHMGITPNLNCRISPWEPDTDCSIPVGQCIFNSPFHAVACTLWFQTAGWCGEFYHLEGAYAPKCEKFWNSCNQCVGPSDESMECSRFGLSLNDFPSQCKERIVSPSITALQPSAYGFMYSNPDLSLVQCWPTQTPSRMCNRWANWSIWEYVVVEEVLAVKWGDLACHSTVYVTLQGCIHLVLRRLD